MIIKIYKALSRLLFYFIEWVLIMNFNDFSPLMEHISTLIFLNINYTSIIGRLQIRTAKINRYIFHYFKNEYINSYTYTWYKLFTINTFKV